jgi:hypothetical protein
MEKERKPFIYICINRDENPSTESTRHVEANLNTLKDQNNQNSSNEVEHLMLKGHHLSQISQ